MNGFPLSTRKRSPAAFAPQLRAKTRFQALWRRCLVNGAPDESRVIFRELLAAYSQPHRHYHTCGHIGFCLEQFDAVHGHLRHPDAVELSIWFHDVIYDVGSPDNELRSAQRFVALSHGCMEPPLIGAVYDMILATYHREPPRSGDARYLVDIDLSSFGLPWDMFRKDSDAVRAEYASVPDADFFSGQLTFLRALLARPNIYSTAFFRDRKEQRARQNIMRYIQELESRGYR